MKTSKEQRKMALKSRSQLRKSSPQGGGTHIHSQRIIKRSHVGRVAGGIKNLDCSHLRSLYRWNAPQLGKRRLHYFGG